LRCERDETGREERDGHPTDGRISHLHTRRKEGEDYQTGLG
jgi:hypothetical protein